MMDETAIRSVVSRLSRELPAGGQVIERAAVMAEGTDSGAILAWIASHDGHPEPLAQTEPGHGLHDRGRGAASSTTPRRYVLPPGAMTRTTP